VLRDYLLPAVKITLEGVATDALKGAVSGAVVGGTLAGMHLIW